MKNNDLNFIEKKQEEIDKQIELITDRPTFDGIINIKEYINSPIKILWILKEINDEDGYNQREAFDILVQKILDSNSLTNTNRKFWYPTMDPIIYISYQILNNFKTWQEINYINEDPSMVGVLRNIAYINIKKEPGSATSNNNELQQGYNKAKNIIKAQIDYIDPDVVIGGNTIKYLKNDFNLTSFKKVDGFNLEYTKSSNRLFIDSYHPQYLSRQNENHKGDYFNEIVNIVKKWKNNL